MPADWDDTTTDFQINGVPINGYLGWIMTWCFNSMAWCPVMSVPSGFGDDGMPTGLQIVGRTYDDPGVFRIASAFEKTRPWRGTRPKI
jgi:Asp-tRNA(Asn)/Glu-tRNA(Gln) amidotransferase A subunit family amidase